MKYLSFDLRALASMRISIAAVLIFDLCIRLTDLEAFYSNTGIVPLEMLFRYGWNDYYISIHTISGLWQVQLVIFLFAVFCAFMLLIGYRTKLFTILSWFLLLSLHNRNGFILQGGDDLLRMVLFWGMFLPWGARYSYDSIITTQTNEPQAVPVNAAMAAYLLQICYLYTGSALLKGPEWNTEFSALYYAYSLDQIAYPITKYIYNYETLLNILTRIVYYFELFIPLLFFIPFAHAFFRTLAVCLIMLFHGINSITLLIGIFPFVGIATSIGILPSTVFDKFDRFSLMFQLGIERLTVYIGDRLEYIIRWKPVLPRPPVYGYIQTASVIFLIVFVFDWNFSNLSFVHSKLSDNLRFIGYGLRLDQSWGMFAPGVFKDDGWYVLKGTSVKNQHKFNLLSPDEELTTNKPACITAMIKNDRWRKYSENFIFQNHEFLRGYFCDYARRIWNERHPDRQINSLEVIYMNELTLPDYQYSKPEETVLWEYKN